MIFRIPRLLSEVSKVMALEEGDVIMTGTPKGVGEVKAGDIMKAGLNVDGIEIEEGTIEVEVRDREGRYTFTET
jgi:acylpyruvate hydrolase